MIWIGLVLGGLGLVDLVRPQELRFDLRSIVSVLSPGAATVGVCLLGDVATWVTVSTTTGVVLIGVVWTVVATWSLGDGRPTWPAFATGVVILTGTVLASPYSPKLGGRL